MLAVATIRHEITPTSWVTTIGTTRAVDHRQAFRWDTAARWDTPPATWSL